MRFQFLKRYLKVLVLGFFLFIFCGYLCRTAVLVQPASGSRSQPWGLREIIYLLNGRDLTICSFISWACRWLVLFLTSVLSQSVYRDVELKECFYSLMLLLFSSWRCELRILTLVQTRQSHFALRKHRQESEQHKQEDNMPNMRNVLFSVGMEEKRNGRTEWGISCKWLKSRGRNEYSVFSQDTQNLLSAELSNTSFIIMSCSYSIDKELVLYSLFKDFLWILQQFLYFNTDLFELNW